MLWHLSKSILVPATLRSLIFVDPQGLGGKGWGGAEGQDPGASEGGGHSQEPRGRGQILEISCQFLIKSNKESAPGSPGGRFWQFLIVSYEE